MLNGFHRPFAFESHIQVWSDNKIDEWIIVYYTIVCTLYVEPCLLYIPALLLFFF